MDEQTMVAAELGVTLDVGIFADAGRSDSKFLGRMRLFCISASDTVTLPGRPMITTLSSIMLGDIRRKLVPLIMWKGIATLRISEKPDEDTHLLLNRNHCAPIAEEGVSISIRHDSKARLPYLL